MKKISILCAAVLLSGCALGIHQNIAEIEGKQYLVSTPTYMGPLGLSQWQGESKFTPLTPEEAQESAINEKVKEVIKSCKLNARTGKSYDYQKFFECVNK